MTHATCRLTAKYRDQLRNPMLGNRVWATFKFYINKEWHRVQLKSIAEHPTIDGKCFILNTVVSTEATLNNNASHAQVLSNNVHTTIHEHNDKLESAASRLANASTGHARTHRRTDRSRT